MQIIAMIRPKQHKITQSNAYRVSLIALLTFSLFAVLYSPPVAKADTICSETYVGWKDKNGDGIPEQYKLDVNCLASDTFPIDTEYCGVTGTFTVSTSAKTSFMTWLDGDSHLQIDQDDVWVDSLGNLVGVGKVHYISNFHVTMPLTINSKSSINCFNGGTDYSTGWHFVMNDKGWYSAAIVDKPPKILGAGDITKEATSASGAAVDFGLTAKDTIDGNLTSSITCAPFKSGDTIPLGTTAISCTVTDSGGFTDTASFNVTVKDTTQPILTVPADIVTNTDLGSANAVVNYAPPTASDNVGVASVTCTPPSGSTFPLGTTTVNCTATDTSGNAASASFTVTVQGTI